jgi:hypothetical protein
MVQQNLYIGIVVVLATLGTPTIGAEYGTIEEAKAMLSRAIVEVKSNGAAAMDKFNRNDRPFRDRDLFVFCFNGQDGKFTAHEAMLTWDVRRLRDKTGGPFGARMYKSARENQVVDVRYMSPVPGSTAQAEKHALITRVGQYVCGVSSYGSGAPLRPTH